MIYSVSSGTLNPTIPYHIHVKAKSKFELYACTLLCLSHVLFLARDAFIRTNRHAIAMMFVSRLYVMGVHCDHTLHFSADLSLWMGSPMWMCKLGLISQERLKIEVKLLLSASRKSYIPRRLAQQRMTLSDLEWPLHASHAISAVAELLVLYSSV